MIEVIRNQGDDAGYLLMVSCVLTSLTEQKNLNKLYLIRLDNWFGSKWLRFSGKILGALGIWKYELTLPPFVPSRIMEESVAVRNQDGRSFDVSTPTNPVHRAISAERATRRLIHKEFPNSTFVWFCGNSEKNGKGAVMVYIAGLEKEDYWCWYAELSSNKHWEPSLLKGISQSQYRELLKIDVNGV